LIKRAQYDDVMNRSQKNTLGTMRDLDLAWSSLQQPLHATALPEDYLRLLAALDEGWQILEVARLSARRAQGLSEHYLLTLTHPARMLARQTTLRKNGQIDGLLEREHVPMG
jgi:hypothetical protein